MDSKPTPSPYAHLAALHRIPEYWLERYMEDGHRSDLCRHIMDSVFQIGDIPRAMRCLPENLLGYFTDIISEVAALKKEEDYIRIGNQGWWGVKEARQVMQWLAEHPHPQLAPPDGKPEPDPEPEPPETEYGREFRKLVERRRLFYAKMLDYVARTQDIPGVLRWLPENVMDDFVHHIEWVADKGGEGDLVRIGDTAVHMRLREARQMKQWLAEHPHPRLAPDTRVSIFGPHWDPLESEHERALDKMLEQSAGK